MEAAQPSVLVVDDEADVRELAAEVFDTLGYAVVTASRGEDALALLDRFPSVRLLFSDIVMAGMDGITLARQAIVRKPALKVLLTTGYFDATAPEFPVLHKPYRLGKLQGLVRELIGDPN
jgi:CheY-like chemotaxis protein